MATEIVKRPVLEADKEVSSRPLRPYFEKIKAGFGKQGNPCKSKGCQFESILVKVYFCTCTEC